MTVLDRSSARPDDGARAVCVGLVAAPELPAQIAVDLAEQLPELLDRHHDGRWRVALAEEPLLAGRESVEEILDAGCQARIAEGWDAAICLTDVPLRDGAQPLVAAVDRDEKVAVVNIPAFGATLLKPRVRKAVVALIGDIAEETLEGPNQLEGAGPRRSSRPSAARRPPARARTSATSCQRGSGISVCWAGWCEPTARGARSVGCPARSWRLSEQARTRC
jgi:hypothetical protein